MTKRELFGVVGPDGELCYVSECDSRIADDNIFDGPALWTSLGAAQEANQDCGGLPDGYRYSKVVLEFE